MIDSIADAHKPSLGHLLARVSRLVGGRMRMKLEEIGLPHAQGMILFLLWRKDGIAQNVLAHSLHITPPTATSTLQRMERDGWIQRHRDAADQRIVRVYLTEKARALRAEARTLFRKMDEELTSVLTDDERRILTSSLLKVQEHLTQGAEDPGGPGLRHEISRDGDKEKR
jgi:DNA-binding MarR family transcriptional regulator